MFPDYDPQAYANDLHKTISGYKPTNGIEPSGEQHASFCNFMKAALGKQQAKEEKISEMFVSNFENLARCDMSIEKFDFNINKFNAYLPEKDKKIVNSMIEYWKTYHYNRHPSSAYLQGLKLSDKLGGVTLLEAGKKRSMASLSLSIFSHLNPFSSVTLDSSGNLKFTVDQKTIKRFQ
jgi:hypothetical protein